MERVFAPDDPRIADFVNIREAEQVRSRGIFIAEGTEVVRTMVRRSRFKPRALLLAERHLASMADVLAEVDAPIYVATPEVLSAIAGFDLHRGCLASGDRGPEVLLPDLLAKLPERAVVVVLEALANHDNVGAIFRNAAAFGAGAVLLDERCADPLYRKSIRVSMGTALTVPFARYSSLKILKDHGFEVWALTPQAGALDLRDHFRAPSRLALLFGTEGAGLTAGALQLADRRMKISMATGVDSLNVATAAAIALFAVSPL